VARVSIGIYFKNLKELIFINHKLEYIQ